MIETDKNIKKSVLEGFKKIQDHYGMYTDDKLKVIIKDLEIETAEQDLTSNEII